MALVGMAQGVDAGRRLAGAYRPAVCRRVSSAEVSVRPARVRAVAHVTADCLRWLLLALLLANGLYFVWSARLVARRTVSRPAQQSEPQRLLQQIQPEALQTASGAGVRDACRARRCRPSWRPRNACRPGLLERGARLPRCRQCAGALLARRAAGTWSAALVPDAGSSTWASSPAPGAMAKKRAELTAPATQAGALEQPGPGAGPFAGRLRHQAAAAAELDAPDTARHAHSAWWSRSTQARQAPAQVAGIARVRMKRRAG